jgi:antitoxin (DNA-binding transcriptional repressor) of toxin-antitoxin stability system
MTRLNVEAPEARLPDLLRRVGQGEEIVLVERGKPVAKLAPHPPQGRNYRSFVGAWKGKVDLSRFDEADEDIAREFGMLD